MNKDLLLAVGTGAAIEFTQVQYEGSKRMDGAAFLRGRKLPLDTKLT